ncbi:MAG: HD-GYP domain-containing protein [Planctomycetes bacterium]|nr:HD-GYP domain-containing protein [Planctomycetota bacterium]
MALGSMLVGLATIMILQVHRGVTSLRRRHDRVRKSAIEAEQHYVDMLRKIMKIVEAREPLGKGHSERVGRFAKQIAGRLGLPPRECELLAQAGELHDIGLMAIPEGLLNTHSTLGANDFHTIQNHSQVSYEILKPLDLLREVLPAIRHHHERMNGTGYPQGISGENIPLGARILAVADAFDAMTHDRPHRSAMSTPAAISELRRCTPHGFDERCVEAMAELAHVPKSRKPAWRAETDARSRAST